MLHVFETFIFVATFIFVEPMNHYFFFGIIAAQSGEDLVGGRQENQRSRLARQIGPVKPSVFVAQTVRGGGGHGTSP